VGCIVALSVSPAKWETFKRMSITFVSFVAAILAVGWLAAWLLRSTLVAEMTGALLVSWSTLAAAIAGWSHIRAIKSQ